MHKMDNRMVHIVCYNSNPNHVWSIKILVTLFNAFDTFTTYVKMYQTKERKSQSLVSIILSIMIHVAYNFVTVTFDYFLFNDQRDKVDINKKKTKDSMGVLKIFFLNVIFWKNFYLIYVNHESTISPWFFFFNFYLLS